MIEPIADTPEPPYYAVIFTSTLTGAEAAQYSATAARMVELAAQQDGFLGFETAHEEIGITVSYWRSLDDIARWRDQVEHRAAQQRGLKTWYRQYRLRVCKVERDEAFRRE